MSLWVAVYKIKRESFLTLDDFYVINYHEINEHILPRYKEIDELPAFPSLKDIRQYIEREEGESKDAYYERALIELPQLQAYYEPFKSILNISAEEQAYLEDNHTQEEVYFVKRCYELAEELQQIFQKEFETSKQFPIVLTEQQLTQFNAIAKQEIPYEQGYMYKLVVG